MSAIVATIEVDRSAQDVFAHATDPTRFNEWQKGVVDGHMDHADGLQVGAHCLTTRHIGGANRPSTSQLTHIDAPKTWGVRGIDGQIRAIVDLTVEPLSTTRSRLTIAVDFEGHGIGKLLVPLLVRREAQKDMPMNLAMLKDRLEATVS
jgi:Polyketide cyclase / dehydrase and lipid transport